MHKKTMIRGVSAAFAAVVVLLGVGIGPAAAHVEPDPEEATKGGSAEIAFQVPTERDDADTVKVELALPADHPIASVTAEPKPGWTIAVAKTKLAKPVQGDDGAVTEAVSRITWSGGKIAPDEFDDFTVRMDPLPTDTDELVFKVLQTYSDGQVVRWIETSTPGGAEPEHPAPVVKLVAGAAQPEATTTTATTTPTTRTAPTTTNSSPAVTTQAASTKGLATKDDVDSAKTVGIIGVVVGVIGVIGAAVAIAMARRRPPI